MSLKMMDGPFIVSSKKSPNNKYEFGLTIDRSGKESYILLENNHCLLTKQISNPGNYKVANNGTFLIVDDLRRNALSGMFYAIDRQGNQLIKKHVQANIFNIGLSADGNYACFQTANNNKNSDGNKLFICDLISCKMLSKFHPVDKWADSYDFDTNLKVLFLYYKDWDRTLTYYFDGTPYIHQ